MSKAARGMLAAVIVVILAGAWWYARPGMHGEAWTDSEIILIRSLWIENLPPCRRARAMPWPTTARLQNSATAFFSTSA